MPHFLRFNKNLDWDNIFTTWILKHGVKNPFKHGVHYIKKSSLHSEDKKDCYKACMVTSQIGVWNKAGAH